MVDTLFNAAQNGDLAAVKMLVAAGADLNATNDNGWTPLHWASKEGHEGIVAKLIAAGANVNARNVNDKTPLHLASYEGREGIVATLIAAGANVNAADKNGKTPLGWASYDGREGIAATLIAAGAHIGPAEWSNLQGNGDLKAVISEQLSRRLAGDIAKAPGDIKAIVLDDDGNLTPDGLDYAYAGVLPEMFKPAHWKGRESHGLEFYETLVKAIPDDLQDDVVPALDLTGLRRGAAKVKDDSSAVERYVRPQGLSPKGVP
jgi:Ankyrin repeats (many copies)